MASAEAPRLIGTLWKRNAGFLRQWRSRTAVVTVDGFLRYKKKSDACVLFNAAMNVMSDISTVVAHAHGYYYFEITSGDVTCAVGFPSHDIAQEWLDCMLDVADENAAGRRAWMANLRRVLSLNGLERRELALEMAERDWINEWSLCLRSLQDPNESITTRQRKLRRLYTIWLQFQQFAEILAEMFFARMLSEDLPAGTPFVESFRRAASDVSIPSSASTVSSYQRSPTLFVNSPGSVRSLVSSSSLSSLTGLVQEIKTGCVDDFKLKTIRMQFGAKSWQGHKRLGKETANLARFRSLTELYLSENPVAVSASARLPAFSLVTAFTLRGIRVLASAELRGDNYNVVPMDKRDLTELTGALKAAKTLRYFPYQDFPELWVRQIPGRKETTLIRVGTRYDDVLCNSLRSRLVHGILVRAAPEHGGTGSKQLIEALSAADLRELVADKAPQSVPYLNLVYYQLNALAQAGENYLARSFLLKTSRSVDIPLRGDIVIAVDDDASKVPLNLLEGFVLKRQVEIHPLVRRLQEIKKNNAVLGLMSAIAASRTGRPRQLVRLGVAHELENNVKIILAHHIKEFSSQLVTLGDVLPTPVARSTVLRSQTIPSPVQQRLARSNTTIAAPRSTDFVSMSSFSVGDRDRLARPAIRRRRSSLAAAALQEEAVDNKGIYVIDALHLRHVMREEGVNMSFLPLVFQHLDGHRQHGMQIIVASEIIVRLAKTLFRYSMASDDTKLLSRWKTRKARTIKFVDSIIHGLSHDDLPGGACSIRECFGDQFWKVDGPIWYALGTFSGCFSLDSRLETQSLEKYRQLLKANPSMLLVGLLRVFGARLAATVLPEIHENRFLTVPFLRSERDLVFDFEDAGVTQEIVVHSSMLWSHLQFFRIQFERVNTSSMSKEDNGSWLQYYQRQARAFREALLFSHGTALERAMGSWEDQTAVRAYLDLALRGVSTSLSPEHQASAHENCRLARRIISTSSALFPVDYKVALCCLELICAGDDLPAGLEKREDLLETLRFFYRPANMAQFAKNASSHPVYSLQFANTPDGFQQPPISKTSSSLRSRLQKEQDRAVWVGVMSAVDAYCRRVETKHRDPVMVASLRAVLSGNRHAGGGRVVAGMPNSFDDYRIARGDNDSKSSDGIDRHDSNSSMDSDSSTTAKIHNSFGGMHYGVSSAPMKTSSQVDALWFIESYLLPPVSSASESWMLPGSLLMANTTRLHKQKSVRSAEIVPDTSVPGAAFLWGKPFGLSLDEEAHLSSTVESAEDSANQPESSITLLRVSEPLRRVVSVSCGYRHTALVTHDRQLYTFGYGECGRLGHGNEESCDEPTLVSYFASLISSEGADAGGVVSASCGREHTMVVTGNGDLYGFGWAEAGRLGTGDSESSLFPARVSALKEKIRDVACGREHTLALTRSGSVYAFGAGFGGRLGNGSESDAELPVLVEGLAGNSITRVDAGECHSCALSDAGDVFTWGFGASGALGHGLKENCLVPQMVEGPWMIKRRGADPSTPMISSIACGSYHTLACSVDGALYGWGDAAAGQLGDELLASYDMVVLTPHKICLPVGTFSYGIDTNGANLIRQIACGTFTSALTTHDGKLYVWGSAAAGNGAKLDILDAQIRRVDALAEFSFAQVACGAHHTVALTRKLEYY